MRLIPVLCLISPRRHGVKLDLFRLGSVDTPGGHVDGILQYKPGLQRCGIQSATQDLNTRYQAGSDTNMAGVVSPYEYSKRQSTTPADCLLLKWDNTAQPWECTALTHIIERIRSRNNDRRAGYYR